MYRINHKDTPAFLEQAKFGNGICLLVGMLATLALPVFGFRGVDISALILIVYRIACRDTLRVNAYFFVMIFMLALIMAFTTLELTDGYASNIFIRDILGLILTFVVAVIILTFSSQRLLFLLKGFIYGNAFFLVLSFIDFYILNIGVFYQKNSWGELFRRNARSQ